MKKFALLGHDISYSISPKIHRLIYECLGVEGSFELLSVAPEELEGAIQCLKTYDGFNVTKPHKITIVPYLHRNESFYGAVNTVRVTDGKLFGYNTDGIGFIRHFSDSFGSVSGLKALVLGAGGVAYPVCDALVKMGAQVKIFNRTLQKAQQVADFCGAEVLNYPENEDALKNGAITAYCPQIIVNCTSLGLKGEQSLPPQICLSGLQIAYDTIYSPPETPFLKACRTAGAKAENGLGLLIWQAIAADEIFFNLQLSNNEQIAAFNAVRSKIYD